MGFVSNVTVISCLMSLERYVKMCNATKRRKSIAKVGSVGLVTSTLILMRREKPAFLMSVRTKHRYWQLTANVRIAHNTPILITIPRKTASSTPVMN